MSEYPVIFFDSFGENNSTASWRFDGYIRTLIAMENSQVMEVLHLAEQAAADGQYAVGFVAYEAAFALNPDLPFTPPVEGLPLAWFALYAERHTVASGSGLPLPSDGIVLEPQKKSEEYTRSVGLIRDYIAAGDCYQTNYTFPLQGHFTGNPPALYSRIGNAQRAPFCAYFDIGRFTVLSASPELFFSLQNGVITTRPMKGTISRGRWPGEDIAAIEQLRSSPKERAENLMIVDLLRSDLGIIAETGSVTVDDLFKVETYPTVHQMTSTVSAVLRPETGLADIFQSLFPCGSVTGAPKRRSMEIIAELENTPRGIYCGAIGCIAPGGEILFSVAIRTALFDRQTYSLSMGVGSAVTWDSDASSEFDECLSKGAFLRQPPRDFQLIESLRLESGGYSLLNRHLERLTASAAYFGFTYDRDTVQQALVSFAAQRSGLCKVRMLLAPDGSLDISSETILENSVPLRIALSTRRVNSSDAMRYHKTTRRELLDTARLEHTDCDEILLLNEHGELTEGSYHTLVVQLNGQLVTPPLICGLLPGVLRGELLDQGRISEKVLYPDDLQRADAVWLINSVRGWRLCVVI